MTVKKLQLIGINAREIDKVEGVLEKGRAINFVFARIARKVNLL